MASLWTFRRRRLLVGAALLAVLAAAGVTISAVGGSPSQRRSPLASPTVAAPAAKSAASGVPHAHALVANPPLVNPAETGLQAQVDKQLAQAESPQALAAALVLRVPAPATTAAFPPLSESARQDYYDFAVAFTTELLDINYAADSRAEVLAWAQSEEAPNTFPGVPAGIANKALYASLADPSLPGGSPSPLPDASGWAANAASHVTQAVTGLQVETSPDWESVISQGWQPRDQLATIQVVTGTITTTRPGQKPAAQPFSLTLALGTSRYHVGYGAISASDYQAG